MAGKLKTAWKQIRRTPYQALIAIIMMFLAFFALSCFALISLGSIKIIKYFESSPQVIAFFEKGKDLSQEEIAQIRLKLETTGEMASFKYVSTHEAEAIYREKNKDDPLLLELVNYKILPPSIEIAAKNIDSLPMLKDILKAQPGVKDIAFYEDIVNSLSKWINNIRLFGLSLTVYLLLQSMLIILIITGMKILSRKEEIEILRLIGASKSFISGPFILEGIFYGVVSAILGWLGAYTLLLYATPMLLSWLGEVDLLPIPPTIMLSILGGELVISILIGSIGSFISVRRFWRK